MTSPITIDELTSWHDMVFVARSWSKPLPEDKILITISNYIKWLENQHLEYEALKEYVKGL